MVLQFQSKFPLDKAFQNFTAKVNSTQKSGTGLLIPQKNNFKLERSISDKCKVLHLGLGNPRYQSMLQDSEIESSPTERLGDAAG